MFGIRTLKAISRELDETTDAINKLTLRAAGLRKELSISGKSPEIQQIIDKQPVGSTLLDGTPATPDAVLEERLNTEFVSLNHAIEVRDTYVHLIASLKVPENNISLPAYGDGSNTPEQVMYKLYASEALRALLLYRTDDIGRFVTISRNGYVSLVH